VQALAQVTKILRCFHPLRVLGRAETDTCFPSLEPVGVGQPAAADGGLQHTREWLRVFCGVATLAQIARHAGVHVEGVLRVLNGDPVSEAVAERVMRAMAALGPPHAQIAKSVSALPESGTSPEEAAARQVDALDETLERARQQLLEKLSETTAGLEAAVPREVGSVVYEALRVEVRPVTQRLGEMSALFEELSRIVDQVRVEVAAERRERLDDLKLLVDLIVTAWQNVDRRLARVEGALARQEERDGGQVRVRRWMQ
jgi:hypothetical protein